MIKEKGFTFDVAYTSVLKRAIKTLNHVLEENDLHWIPVHKTWRLNERMYGGLQGLNKSETAAKHGEAQVKIWRRAYDIPPPPLDTSDPRYPGHEPKYAMLDNSVIPVTECLKDTVVRVLPFWFDEIVPAMKSGRKVLITAHGNSLRALIKYLDKIPDDKIVELNIPTGIPLVYELDENMRPIKHYYLADEATVAAAINSVANQGKAK
ncbi:hypothetical protein AAHC03_01843 [Spirometra sp. Aus1]|nr:unnamed protein product [Spirometra erinaceieuropaei]